MLTMKCVAAGVALGAGLHSLTAASPAAGGVLGGVAVAYVAVCHARRHRAPATTVEVDEATVATVTA